MSRRPFDPEELGERTVGDPVVRDLERYADQASREVPSPDFVDRVSAAIEAERPPSRGPLAWLTTAQASGGGFRRLARASVLLATLALAVAAVLLAGQLASLVRDLQVGTSPSPAVIESNPPSPSISPASPSEAEGSPAGSPSASKQGEASPTPGGSDDESKTPRPSATETPSPTPEASSNQSSDG